MKNSKTTKRALVSSAVAIILCVTMLVGNTFAWFTDTAFTSVNTIQAGTFDVALEMKVDGKWVSAEGKTLNFVAADGNEEILWEPGCTYNLETLRIVNKGNLALKCNFYLSFANATENENGRTLADVLTVNFEDWVCISGNESGLEDQLLEDIVLLPGGTTEISLSLTWKPTDHDNDYQGLSIDGAAITVVATQYTYESDSKDHLYDANATYSLDIWDGTTVTDQLTSDENGVYHIKSAADFVEYLTTIRTQNDKGYYNVVLDCDIDFGGHTIEVSGTSNPFSGTFDGQNHTVSNYVIKRTDGGHYTGLFSIESWSQGGRTTTIKNLTVKNGTVISDGNQVAAIVPNVEKGAIVENCNAIDCTVIGNKKVGAVAGYVCNGTVSNCSAENCSVYASDSRNNQATVFGYNNDGTFTNNTDKGGNTVKTGVTTVSSAAELATALNVDRKGDVGTILLTDDITVENWTAAKANYASFVLDGNGHSISGLTDALISSIGPNCDVTIKNLTLKDVAISNTIEGGTTATVGALINCINSEGGNTKLTVDNCHVDGGSIYGWKYAGGFIGMLGGGENNSTEIKNSSVKNVAISTTDSSAGGFVAHTHSNLTITNSSVLGNTSVSCAENREGGNAKAGWFVGTVNANTTTIYDCTVNTTGTLKNNNSTGPLNNGFIGRSYVTVNVQ